MQTLGSRGEAGDVFTMRMFRAGILLAVLLLCGGAGPMMTTEKLAAIRRVAVMSAVGDKFTVRKIGITVFGNDEKEFPIDAWGVDPLVVNKMRSVPARRFEVRPVAPLIRPPSSQPTSRAWRALDKSWMPATPMRRRTFGSRAPSSSCSIAPCRPPSKA
jgi:hypothetical protein